MTDDTFTIKEVLSEFRTEVSSRFDTIEQKQDHTNGRVRMLEKFMWGLAGGIAVLGVIVSAHMLTLSNDTSQPAQAYQK